MMGRSLLACAMLLFAAACASPPQADPSKVEVSCGQSCSANLAECSKGFKMFPVVQQKQCNDNYDVCIKGCPARAEPQDGSSRDVAARLKQLDELLETGAISETEYEAKRQEILKSL